jgi:hypothetical protein
MRDLYVYDHNDINLIMILSRDDMLALVSSPKELALISTSA